jgi:hypothetical protein
LPPFEAQLNWKSILPKWRSSSPKLQYDKRT